MKPLLILFVTALLTGCVSVRSNVKPDAVPSFDRILVVTKMDHPSKDYEQTYLNAFPRAYQVCAVGLTPLSFGNPDSTVAEQARTCNSDVILTITETKRGGVAYAQVGGVVQSQGISSEYLAEMRSSTTGQAFWKAQLQGSLAPRTIVKRLLKDGVLTGKIPTPVPQQAFR